MFPSDGAQIRLTAYVGGEWPDPLSSCPEYKAPTGLPITLQLTPGRSPKLSSYLVTRSGGAVEACGFDALSYRNSDTFTQRWGRNVLASSGVVVVVPKTPFESGNEYGVSMVVDGRTYSWHFLVE
jgi:hypothetical protein